MKQSSELFLTLIFVFAMILIINANSKFERQEDKSTLEEIVADDCWAQADVAEAALWICWLQF